MILVWCLVFMQNQRCKVSPWFLLVGEGVGHLFFILQSHVAPKWEDSQLLYWAENCSAGDGTELRNSAGTINFYRSLDGKQLWRRVELLRPSAW